MNLNNLPDVEFVSAQKEEVVADVMKLYQEITGRSLAQGDPVRLFLLVIADLLIQQRAFINYTGKQNLLRYAAGNNLDHLGMLVGVERLGASAAATTIRITLSEKRSTNTVIPAGTRVTAGDNVFFALDNVANIPAGKTTVDASASCTQTGSIGNGYAAGELNVIVDPQPFVNKMVNITLSEGGADVESDDSLRASIQEAPERFSNAGSSGAYEYHAKRASALISDVAIDSPNPGEVVIVPLLENGEIPGDEILSKVLEVCNDRSVRPLTDNVIAKAPTVINYTVKITYYINQDDEVQASSIQEAVEDAVNSYVLWQKTKLGRDINPSELISRVMQAGAKRVTVASPTYKETGSTELAVATSVSVNMGGFEDD